MGDSFAFRFGWRRDYRRRDVPLSLTIRWRALGPGRRRALHGPARHKAPSRPRVHAVLRPCPAAPSLFLPTFGSLLLSSWFSARSHYSGPAARKREHDSLCAFTETKRTKHGRDVSTNPLYSLYRSPPSPPIRFAFPRSGSTWPAGIPSSVFPSALSFASSSSGESHTS